MKSVLTAPQLIQMKPNKNAEQVAVADHHGDFLVKFSHHYNLNTFVNARSLRGVGYAMTLCAVPSGAFLIR